jgi:ferritin-like metal-binding protein YciE
MPAKISNPRDLILQLLGDALYLERRLAGGVLQELIDAVSDAELKEALQQHLEETKAHVDRAETAFRRLDAAPSANMSRSFEAAKAEHDELAGSIVDPKLADVFHTRAALQTEHDEIALYTAVLALADLEPLRDSLQEERLTREKLERLLRRLADQVTKRR